ncbi:MAG: hypothetical protein VR78_03730 [Hoeflea sp. BRH_c9]|nr:MAG: hypothetical protein VR78_03730 [Hoeflea sp. BRH_c9]
MKATTILATIAGLSILAAGVVGSQAWRYRLTAIEAQTELASTLEKQSELARQIETLSSNKLASQEQMQRAYRASWHLILGREFETNLEYAIAVTDYVHRNVPIGMADTPGTVANRLTRAVLLMGEQAICGDFSLFSKTILENSGVPARTVQLATAQYVNGEQRGATHVTVEALINNKWTLFDPTFNSIFSCGDETLIGVEEARTCGANLVAVQSPSTLPGRSVAEYPVPYPQLLEYSLAAGTMVGTTFVEQVGLPNMTWLAEARARYKVP